jgi:hypothetical protein
MSIATTLNWRRSILGNASACTPSAALGQPISTVIEPIWPVDASSPMASSQPAPPDVTTLAVLWGRQAS